MKGFRDFLTRGNLLELAVAFIMGAAFASVVTAFTDIIMGIISKIFGGNADFSTITVGGVNIGKFLTALVAFVLIALVLYFLIVKPFTALRERLKKAEAEAAGPTEAELLTQIRDLLAQTRGSGAAPAA